jgi:hypothetical protein
MTRRAHSGTVCGLVVVAALALCSAATAGQPKRAPVVVVVKSDGFHWGDAAIGAAATLGLTLATGGALLLARTPSRPERKNHA